MRLLWIRFLHRACEECIALLRKILQDWEIESIVDQQFAFEDFVVGFYCLPPPLLCCVAICKNCSAWFLLSLFSCSCHEYVVDCLFVSRALALISCNNRCYFRRTTMFFLITLIPWLNSIFNKSHSICFSCIPCGRLMSTFSHVAFFP